MHYVDNDNELYEIFYEEFSKWYQSLLKISSVQRASFGDFIDQKDIGIHHTGFKIYEITGGKDAYIIGTSNIGSLSFKHEIRHGLYFLNKDYKKRKRMSKHHS